MENILNSIYRKDYMLGYSKGLNPFLETIDETRNNLAFNRGFSLGRLDYENMNGRVCDGIPALVVTEKVLEDFLMAGMLGMSIDAEGYTQYQINIISKWYESGVEKYEPNESIYLLALLERNGIETN